MSVVSLTSFIWTTHESEILRFWESLRISVEKVVVKTAATANNSKRKQQQMLLSQVHLLKPGQDRNEIELHLA